MASDDFEKGLKIRKAVVGADHVERSLANADVYSMPLQQLATEFAWGRVWGREDVLGRRERSILNLGMLVALNRPQELEVHIVGALNNGLSEIEIAELILQTAVYCGFPAALDAMATARKVFAKSVILINTP